MQRPLRRNRHRLGQPSPSEQNGAERPKLRTTPLHQRPNPQQHHRLPREQAEEAQRDRRNFRPTCNRGRSGQQLHQEVPILVVGCNVIVYRERNDVYFVSV